MFYHHEITIKDKRYNVLAVTANHNGRAVLISLFTEGVEVGLIKMVASIPDAVIKWGPLSDEQFLQEAWSQFMARELAAAALSSGTRLLEFELQ